MPIYEYRCKSCGEEFEQFRSIQDGDSGVKCPKCGSADPERVISQIFGQCGGGGSSCLPSSG